MIKRNPFGSTTKSGSRHQNDLPLFVARLYARVAHPGQGEHKAYRENIGLSLDIVAREQHIPRDLLVEFSILQLLPVINKERQRHELRKQLFKEMSAHLRHGRAMLEKARELLGEDDPFFAMLAQQVYLGEKTLMYGKRVA